jgi:hypothetical protein
MRRCRQIRFLSHDLSSRTMPRVSFFNANAGERRWFRTRSRRLNAALILAPGNRIPSTGLRIARLGCNWGVALLCITSPFAASHCHLQPARRNDLFFSCAVSDAVKKELFSFVVHYRCCCPLPHAPLICLCKIRQFQCNRPQPIWVHERRLQGRPGAG